jgi:hypothetical protein
MGPLRRFWRLPASDQSLLFQAALWLMAARFGLWLLPLRLVRRLLAPRSGSPWSRRSRSSPERIGWAVATAGRLVPRATCLPQALAAEALLLRRRYPVALRIGVVRTAPGHLTAHAWVESGGRLGDLRDLSRYAPLPPLPGATP